MLKLKKKCLIVINTNIYYNDILVTLIMTQTFGDLVPVYVWAIS